MALRGWGMDRACVRVALLAAPALAAALRAAAATTGVALLLGAPGAAQAAEFTVTPAGSTEALTTALSQAKVSPGADVVRIPAGSYAGPFFSDDTGGLELAGAGVGATILSGGVTGTTLGLSGGAFTASGLSVAGGATGIRILGAGATLAVRDTTVDGATNGLIADAGATLTADRVKVLNAQSGVAALRDGSQATISDSLITLPYGVGGVAMEAGDHGSVNKSSAEITAHRVTAVGAYGVPSIGLAVRANSMGDRFDGAIDNSALFNMSAPIVCSEAGGGNATLIAAWVSQETLGANVAACPGFFSYLNVYPVAGFLHFVNPAAGDYRPTAFSAAVNKGDESQTTATIPGTDLAGRPRVAQSHLDVGAYEYQALPPVISVTAASDSVAVGAGAAFEAVVSEPDGDYTLPVDWTFDDGTTTTGLQVSHPFATAGAHTATASVVDASGLTASASATITVTQAGVDLGGSGGPQRRQSGVVRDATAPVVTIALPACGKRSAAACTRYRSTLGAWRTVTGTITDAAPSSGIGRIEVTAYRKVGQRFYGFTGKGFKRTSESKAISGIAKAAVRGTAWSLKLPGLTTGKLKLAVLAYDAAGNPSAVATKTITLR